MTSSSESTNLLSRFGLPDQVGVGTSGSNELLDVLDLILLLLVGLGLVDLLLSTSLVVCVVVPSVVEEFLLTHVNHVCADTVQEVHGEGLTKSALASATRIRHPPDMSFVFLLMVFLLKPRPVRMRDARVWKVDGSMSS